MIGLGLVSYGRPDYRALAIEAIEAHCALDEFVVIEDVSPVGVAKNQALEKLLASGCDWLFLSEDDVIVQSPLAIGGYVDACVASGYEHLMFHAHGYHNPRPLRSEGSVTLWPNYVGAWSIYSRRCLEVCGLFDEHFANAWDHVEHTLRLSLAGFTAPWRGAADATGSEDWLKEIPGSIENSSIRHTPEWMENFNQGKLYWAETHPETFRLVFPNWG